MASRKPVKRPDVENQDVQSQPVHQRGAKRQVDKNQTVPPARRLPKERIITWSVIGVLLVLMLFEWQSRRAYRKTLAEFELVSLPIAPRMITKADVDNSVYGWASKRDVTENGKSYITLHWPSLFRTYTIWLSVSQHGFVTAVQTGATPQADEPQIPQVAAAPNAAAPPIIANRPPQQPGAFANSGNVPASPPSSAPSADVTAFLESPVAKAFQKCHQLYFRNPEEPSLNEEVIQLLQSVAGRLPKLELSTKPQEATWNHVKLFEGGIPFSAFRFSSTLDQPADFAWIYAGEEWGLFWYILPVRGEMSGFTDFRRVEFPRFQDPSSPLCDVAFFQTLGGGEIKPNQDYIVYFTADRLPNESRLSEGLELARKSSNPLAQLAIPLLKAEMESERAKTTLSELSIAARLLPSGTVRPSPTVPEIAELVRSPIYSSSGGETLCREVIPVQAILAAPNPNQVVLCGQRNAFRLWDLSTNSAIRSFHTDEEGDFRCAAISPDGKRLATSAEHNPKVLIWDLENSESQTPLKSLTIPWNGKEGSEEFGRVVQRLSFLKDQDHLFAYMAPNGDGRWGEAPQWSISKDREIARTFLGQHLQTLPVPIRGGEQLIAVRSQRNPQSTSQKDQWLFEIVLIDSASGETKASIPLGTRWTFGNLAVSPDEKLATISLTDSQIVLDCIQLKILQRFPTGVTGKVSGRSRAAFAVWSPDSRLLALAYLDASVRVWDVRNDRLVKIWRGHVGEMTSLAFTSDGKWLVSAADDGTVRRWPQDATSLEVITNSLGMKLVPLPEDEFLMGTPSGYGDQLGVQEADAVTEMPAHRVRISQPFYMGMHEVTVKQFRAFVEATAYKTTAETNGLGGNHILESRRGFQPKPEFTWRNPGFQQADDHPVVQVSWDDAQAFCKWLSNQENVVYRLPTEAEWEYACRAGESAEPRNQWNTRLRFQEEQQRPETLYGNAADQTIRNHYQDYGTAWPHNDGYAFTAPAGSFAPNFFGLHDMHGNAYEWCADRFDRLYYRSPPVYDPKGPATGKNRVQRGGSFFHPPNIGRSCCRDFGEPNEANSCLGFRVVREMTPPTNSKPDQN